MSQLLHNFLICIVFWVRILKEVNREYQYTISFTSYFPHLEETMYSLLECKSLSELIFPSSSPVQDNEQLVKVSSIKDIKIKNLINEQSSDSDLFLYLYGDSGIDLTIRIIIETIMGNSSLVLNFSKKESALSRVNVELMEALFSELLPIFKPYYASAYGKSIGLRYLPSGQHRYYWDSLSKRHYPLEIRWITYFGIEMLDFLGIERFKKLKTCFKKYELFQGIMVILQKDPPLLDVPSHQELRDKAESELEFLELLTG